MKLLLTHTGMIFLPLFAQAQVSFTGIYSESFDSLGPSGTDYPAGWSGARYAGTGLSGPLTLGITAGTATGGGLYNVGATGDADRALGTLASGSTIGRFGLQLVNNTGLTLDQVALSGLSQQWRTGNDDTVNESVTFEYSLDAQSLDDPNATFLPLATLDLMEILTAATTAGAVDGHANQASLSGTISGAGWANGATLTLRWSDHDEAGSDGLYALDNFSVVAVPEPSGVALLGAGALGLLARRARRGGRYSAFGYEPSTLTKLHCC